MTQQRGLRVAVVGSGPAGVYAVQALVRARPDAGVDVFDRLPAPFGLVRYGVAPDHPKIKSIGRALARVMESPGVRFLGNVGYGTDITAEDLRHHYDAVIHAHGAAADRRLGVPGEDLPGSLAAADFVRWYNGDPSGPASYPLTATRVAVIGAGNVALDAARMLVTGTPGLGRTDVPDAVLAAYHANRAADVHLFARRGPQHTKFTTPELRELADLPDVDLVVPADDVPEPSEDDDAEYDRTTRNNLAVLRDWAHRAPTGAAHRIHFWFWRRPVEIGGDGRVATLRVERTSLVDGRVAGTGELDTVPVESVLRAVGYGGLPAPGVPFDEATGTVPNAAGRVVDAAGVPVPGVYVAGWLKRGPTGVIGTNKADAAETVRTLLADLESSDVPRAAEPEPEAVDVLLTKRGVRYTTWDGWLRLERYEAECGQRQDRPAAKVATLPEMLAHADGEGPDAAGDPHVTAAGEAPEPTAGDGDTGTSGDSEGRPSLAGAGDPHVPATGEAPDGGGDRRPSAAAEGRQGPAGGG